MFILRLLTLKECSFELSCYDRIRINLTQKRLFIKTNKNCHKKIFVYFLLAILSVIIASNNVKAQKVTIHAEKQSLQKVMKMITEQTGFDFFYSAEVLKLAKPVTINENSESLHIVLDKIFKDQPFIYSISNNTIVLKVNSSNLVYKKNINQPTKSYGIAIGQITDGGGTPLAGIEVRYVNSDGVIASVLSDDQGKFQVPTLLGGKIQFAAKGFAPKEVIFNGENNLSISMGYKGNILPDVKVSLFAAPARIDPTVSINMTNRAYMNLSQVLQGTIPGLSLQIVNSSKKVVTSVSTRLSALGGWRTYTTDQFLRLYPTTGQNIIDALLNGQSIPGLNMGLYSIKTQTNVTSSLIPQLRGSNTFSTSANGMLVVIDGFPKDEFPADYPMANVESVEVIKDPKELIKWGPKANGGIIMIKTKSPKNGHLSVNYNSNFYYSPAPVFNRDKMQLASSDVILDYMRDLLDSNKISFSNYSSNPLDLNPAQMLLYKKMNNLINESSFNQSWDSLKQLNNESQLNSLMQNVFNHNHSLSMFGAVKHYKFSVIGSYNSTKTNALGNYSHTKGLNMNHDLSLFDDKLKIQLYTNLMDINSNAGTTFDPNNRIQPYQMLLNKNGQYVYDYPGLSADVNALIMKNGYYNYGVNILEDARLNSNKSKSFQTQSRLNMTYQIVDGIQWTSSVLYNTNNTKNSNYSSVNSSTVRRLMDTYGDYGPIGINYYVPYGDMMIKSKSNEKQLNVRTALSIVKTFGKHRINASVGGGGYLYLLRRPAYSTMYGYNSNTGTASPIYVPSKNILDPINNYTSLINGNNSTVYPGQLLNPIQGDSINNRNLNLNASLGYSFNNKFFINGTYTNVYNPNYGQVPSYSTLSTKSVSGTMRLIQKSIERWFNKLDITTSLSETQMPNLPVSYSNQRYYSTEWGTYAIFVTGYSPSQQGGQKSQKISEALTSQFWKGHIELNIALNRQKTSNMSNENSLGIVTHDSSSVLNYLSTGAVVNLRKNFLRFNVNYNKSPEGQSQLNGDLSYDIAKESYFHSNTISSLSADIRVENISPMQGLGLMMETNSPQSSGGFSLATNGAFNSMPPKNTNLEIHTRMAISKDKYSIDLRYYNHSTAGLSSNIPIASDPSSGLSSQYTYSIIKNKGVEFYLQGELIKTKNFSYLLTVNGAYNVNIANSVPPTLFTASSSYTTAYRNGYNTANIWSYRWAGLDNHGNPQIYDKQNNIVSNPDSATLSNSLIYSGVTRAPWTGGIIQEFNFYNFFSRIALNLNLGGVMRRYIPSPSTDIDKSVLIKDRWRRPGDEKTTDIAAISSDGSNSTYRSFMIKNSSNSIVSADNIRLQEIMIGWRAPQNFLKNNFIRSFIITFQVQNAALWTKNKWRMDPSIVSGSGEIGMSVPIVYSGSLNLSF